MRIEETDDRTIFEVVGPVRLGDVFQCLELAQLAAASGRPVEIDLSAAEHLHAAAWQVLCALVRTVRASGRPCGIRSLSPAAKAACDLVGLAGELSVEAA